MLAGINNFFCFAEGLPVFGKVFASSKVGPNDLVAEWDICPGGDGPQFFAGGARPLKEHKIALNHLYAFHAHFCLPFLW